MASTPPKGGGSSLESPTGVPDPLPGQVILGGHEWPFDPPDGPEEAAGADKPPPQPNPPPDMASSNEEENFASTLDMEAIKVRQDSCSYKQAQALKRLLTFMVWHFRRGVCQYCLQKVRAWKECVPIP